MAMTKEQRDALPASEFAFPRTRQCPLNDERHTRLAWDMVDRTQGVSDGERADARRHILRRAHDLGIDTSTWSTLKAALELEAMSLAVPKTDGHANKMPFRGVLTRIDQPSDAAPHGSGGRRVLLSRAAAEQALPGLLGMGVDCTADLGAHDAQNKIGIITDASINGDAIDIEGFVWASDFPDTAARIRASKDELGFSYEMKNVLVADPGADILVIESCTFTGAAILKKDDAAYHSTSLAASRDRATGDLDMTKEELAAIFGPALQEALVPIKAELDNLKAEGAKTTAALEASKEVQGKVRPHADALRACSAAMQAAGIGGHPTAGHVVRLNKMADHMEAAAAMGQIPHVYRDHDFLVDAGADTSGRQTAENEVPAWAKTLQEGLAAMGTKVEDLKGKAFSAAAQPERKTLSPDLTRLLAKNGISAAGEEAPKVTVAQFDGFLDAAGVDRQTALTMKLKAREAGVLVDVA
jgi:hypothetical protein